MVTPDQRGDDPIKHVVLLILENHSMDEMLGDFKAKYPGMEGVDRANLRSNLDPNGKQYVQKERTARRVLVDPRHYFENVLRQMEGGNAGFMRDFVLAHPKTTEAERQAVMEFYPRGFLPALHGLADDFMICDHWFSPVPSGTWPARFFAVSGQSNGEVGMPMDGQNKLDIKGWFAQDQVTIFDALRENGIASKVYFNDIPMSWVMRRMRRAENAALYFPIEQFYEDARGSESAFPAFCLIEPRYQGKNRTDDHPPQDVMMAQKELADIYNALSANPELFASTLFVIYYDEHGGFYDHVVPPEAVPPNGNCKQYNFQQYGPRVPAVLVSPWVKRGFSDTVFDHTSLLKYVLEKHGLDPHLLGDRTVQANSVGALIGGMDGPRTDFASKIELTPAQLAMTELGGSEDEVVDDLSRASLLMLTLLLDPLENGMPRFWSRISHDLEYRRIAHENRKRHSDEEILRRHKAMVEAVPRYAEAARRHLAEQAQSGRK